MTMTKTDLTKFLKQIRAADVAQVEAQFQIANVLTAIKDHKLYEMGGYNNFSMMVRGELDFGPTCANRYVALHHNYTEYRYTKKEFTKLMQQFGWRRVEEGLRTTRKKMGYRAMKAFMDAREMDSSGQYNFNIQDKKTAAKVDSLLIKHGCEVSKGGRRGHLSDAFLAIMDEYEILLKASKKPAAKRKLTAVA